MTTPRKPPTGWSGGFRTYGRAPNPDLGWLLIGEGEPPEPNPKYNRDGEGD